MICCLFIDFCVCLHFGNINNNMFTFRKNAKRPSVCEECILSMQGEPIPGHCQRTDTRGSHFKLQCRPRSSMSRSGQGSLPSLSALPRLRGPFCHPQNLQSTMLLLLNPPWSSTTLNHKIPCHLRAIYMHLLVILTFHYTCTQLWNQAHNRRRLSPFQTRLILFQKCRPSGEKLGEFFKRRRTRHGLLASASILFRETSSFYCRLRKHHMEVLHVGPSSWCLEICCE
jgi:hypothetical protein